MNLDKYFKEKYLIFLDIEFQTFNIKGRQNPYILELGVIIFERNNTYPILIDHVNFPFLPFENIRLIGEEYTTVSKETEIDMKDLEDKFILSSDLEDVKLKEKLIQLIPNKKVKDVLKKAIKENNQSLLDNNKELINKYAKKALFNLFFKRIPKQYQNLFKKYMNLYKNDSQVIKRTKDPKEYLKLLNNYIKDGLLVHKETMDLEAIKNDSDYYKIPIIIKNRFDIAIYNNHFNKLNISPSLHNSYIYLYDNKITKNSDLLKYHNNIIEMVKEKMNFFKPHNPLVDAFMTVFVFMLMSSP